MAILESARYGGKGYTSGPDGTFASATEQRSALAGPDLACPDRRRAPPAWARRRADGTSGGWVPASVRAGLDRTRVAAVCPEEGREERRRDQDTEEHEYCHDRDHHFCEYCLSEPIN